MAVETEIKVRVSSHEPVRSHLIAAGALGIGSYLEHNVILDRPDGSLRAAGCGLRIRENRYRDGGPATAAITFKGPVQPGPMKSREEIDFGVDDCAGATELFDRLGFVPILVYEKLRESWLLEDCRVELDEPPKIGLFVEIEGPTESLIRKVRDRIGLANAEPIRESYVRLLVDYCDRHGISPRIMRMEHARKQ